MLLIHGIAGCKENWDAVIPSLARHCTVIAPDLPGHGASGSSATDYSIGALAATTRDLLLALGHERATLVGHSLGGGVAMQFAYLFPEHTERLVLVSSGGLGRTVNPLLRSAALPGSEVVVAGIGHTARAVGKVLGPVLGFTGIRVQPDFAEVGRGMASLAESGTRAAFLSTLRSVVGPVGHVPGLLVPVAYCCIADASNGQHRAQFGHCPFRAHARALRPRWCAAGGSAGSRRGRHRQLGVWRCRAADAR